jgi:hypothetical protein
MFTSSKTDGIYFISKSLILINGFEDAKVPFLLSFFWIRIFHLDSGETFFKNEGRCFDIWKFSDTMFV